MQDDADLVGDVREGLAEPVAVLSSSSSTPTGVIVVGGVVASGEGESVWTQAARAVSDALASAGTPLPLAIASISSEARSNSSSESTGVPSKGRSRVSSSHERQPPYSSRTLTVTGRGMR